MSATSYRLIVSLVLFSVFAIATPISADTEDGGQTAASSQAEASSQTESSSQTEAGNQPETSVQVEQEVEEATQVAVPVGGLVSDPDSNPVSGANVYLLRQPNGAYTLPVHPEVQITDDQGRYLFEDIGEGAYQLWAESGELTSLERMLGGKTFRITSESREGTRDANLNLHPGCGYDVSVKDENGDPIAGAKIKFGWTDLEREFMTGDDGIATIRGLASNDWYFIVGAAEMGTEFKKTARQELGTVEKLEFSLSPGGSMKILIHDDYGEAVVGAKLYIGADDIAMSPSYATPISDENGTCRVTGLPLSRPIRLHATIDGYETEFRTESLTEPGKVVEIEYPVIKRPYGGDVIFTVIDEYGDPVEGATLENMGRSSAHTRNATTDENGVARLNNLYEKFDEFEVSIHARTMVPQILDIQPGTQEEPAQVEITMIRGGTLRGKVVTPDGEPVGNMRVYYNDGENADDLGGRVMTDEEGRFQIQGLPEQSILTLYTPQRFAPVNDKPVNVPQNDISVIEIELEPEAVIRARAVDAETKEPLSEFNVKIDFCEVAEEGDVTQGGITSTLRNPGTNVHGTMKEFRLGHLPHRRVFKLIVSAKGYETITIDRVVAVVEKDSELLDVELKKE